MIGGLGKTLVIAGGILLLIGVVLIVAGRLGLPLGRLPGDIVIERRGIEIRLPIVTSLLLSVFLTVLLNLVLRR
jgi:hypothetical protein